MSALITVIHVVVCIVLILVVLLQSGKAADLAGAFGGGGSATAFGPRGTASLLSKVTTAGAILFMLTSLSLWILSGRGTKSAVSGEAGAPVKPPAAQTAKPEAAKPEAAKAAEAAAPKAEPQKAASAPGAAAKAEPQTKPAAPPVPEAKKK